MARRRTISAGGSGFQAGDFFRTVLGMVGFNTFTICKPDDESLYCKVTQYFQLMIIAFIVIALLYFVFKFLTPVLVTSGGKKYKYTNAIKK